MTIYKNHEWFTSLIDIYFKFLFCKNYDIFYKRDIL